MLWLAIPFAVILGKVIYDASSSPSPPAPEKTVLQKNLLRLGSLLRKEPGYKVAILGQPGAGKSSLLKKMTKGQVTPLPVIGIQTDATDWSQDHACALLSHYQDFIFVDAPGYDTITHPLGDFLQHFPVNQFDAFLLVINGKLHDADEKIYRLIRNDPRFSSSDSSKSPPLLVVRGFSEDLEDSERHAIKSDVSVRLSSLDGPARSNHPVHFNFVSNRTTEGLAQVIRDIRPK